MMNKPFKVLGLTSTAVLMLTWSAQAQTVYDGNGNTGFGGPVGDGMLTLSDNGTTLSGTIVPGDNVSSTTGKLYDEAVIYIDSKPGGFTSTSTFSAALQGNGAIDILQQAAAGTSNAGTPRATLDFATGFGANYAIALSPNNGMYGAIYSIASNGTLDFIQSVNLAPTNSVGPYTFSFSLSDIESPGIPLTGFEFSTTYLNAHDTNTDGTSIISRSNEAFGNSITDTTNVNNNGAGNDPGTDTSLATFSTYTLEVPEPGTWVAMLVGLAMLAGSEIRRRRI